MSRLLPAVPDHAHLRSRRHVAYAEPTVSLLSRGRRRLAPLYYGSWSAVPSYGWTWIGIDRWSWPTHHYGRWGYGRNSWFWIPGRTWGAAWVSWAAASDYVSWCPLGFDGRPVFGFSAAGSDSRWRYGAGGYRGWNGWTVMSRGQFGARCATHIAMPASAVNCRDHASSFITPAKALPQRRRQTDRARGHRRVSCPGLRTLPTTCAAITATPAQIRGRPTNSRNQRDRPSISSPRVSIRSRLEKRSGDAATAAHLSAQCLRPARHRPRVSATPPVLECRLRLRAGAAAAESAIGDAAKRATAPGAQSRSRPYVRRAGSARAGTGGLLRVPRARALGAGRRAREARPAAVEWLMANG